MCSCLSKYLFMFKFAHLDKYAWIHVWMACMCIWLNAHVSTYARVFQHMCTIVRACCMYHHMHQHVCLRVSSLWGLCIHHVHNVIYARVWLAVSPSFLFLVSWYACMYTRARAHTHTHTHTHARARARAHTQTQRMYDLSPLVNVFYSCFHKYTHTSTT